MRCLWSGPVLSPLYVILFTCLMSSSTGASLPEMHAFTIFFDFSWRMAYRGDRTGPDHRHLMHSSFPYGRLASMIKYKAEWEGLPVIQLTRQETYGTSSRCSECGSYTRKSGRMLHCESCDIWINRDINACISQAKRGLTRLVRSLLMEKGPPAEAVNQFKDGEQMAGSHILSTGS